MSNSWFQKMWNGFFLFCLDAICHDQWTNGLCYKTCTKRKRQMKIQLQQNAILCSLRADVFLSPFCELSLCLGDAVWFIHSAAVWNSWFLPRICGSLKNNSVHDIYNLLLPHWAQRFDTLNIQSIIVFCYTPQGVFCSTWLYFFYFKFATFS